MDRFAPSPLPILLCLQDFSSSSSNQVPANSSSYRFVESHTTRVPLSLPVAVPRQKNPSGRGQMPEVLAAMEEDNWHGFPSSSATTKPPPLLQ